MPRSLHSTNCVLAICGPPDSGKTYLAERLSVPVVHTDDWANLPWDEQPDRVMDMLRQVCGTPYAVEGCTVVRLLKRGFSPQLVLHLEDLGKLEGKKRSMAASVQSNWDAWTWNRATIKKDYWPPVIVSHTYRVIEDLHEHNFQYLKAL